LPDIRFANVRLDDADHDDVFIIDVDETTIAAYELSKDRSAHREWSLRAAIVNAAHPWHASENEVDDIVERRLPSRRTNNAGTANAWLG
jgi:hypothetical protein